MLIDSPGRQAASPASLTVQGAKNSVLPRAGSHASQPGACAASGRCPRLQRRGRRPSEILRHLGCAVRTGRAEDLLVDTAETDPLGRAGSPDAPDALVGGVSGSHSGPLRTGGAVLSRRLRAGARPIDLHLCRPARPWGRTSRRHGGQPDLPPQRPDGRRRSSCACPAWEPRKTPCWPPAAAEGSDRDRQRRPGAGDRGSPDLSADSMGAEVAGGGQLHRQSVEGGRAARVAAYTRVMADRIVAATLSVRQRRGTGGDVRTGGRGLPAPFHRHRRCWRTAGCTPHLRRDLRMRLQAPPAAPGARPGAARRRIPAFRRTPRPVLMAALLRADGSDRVCGEHFRQPLPPCVRSWCGWARISGLEGRVAVVCRRDRLRRSALVQATDAAGRRVAGRGGPGRPRARRGVTGLRATSQRGYEDLDGRAARSWVPTSVREERLKGEHVYGQTHAEETDGSRPGNGLPSVYRLLSLRADLCRHRGERWCCFSRWIPSLSAAIIATVPVRRFSPPAAISEGDNLFLHEQVRCRRRSITAALPYVESVRLSRKLPGTLRIDIVTSAATRRRMSTGRPLLAYQPGGQAGGFPGRGRQTAALWSWACP